MGGSHDHPRKATALRLDFGCGCDARAASWRAHSGRLHAGRVWHLDSVREDGSLPFDLLAAGDYESVLSLLGPNEARRVVPPKLSEGARAARAPRRPDELVGALQNRIHREGGTARAARSVRVRGGG